MTYTEKETGPISSNATITVDRWNGVAASTRYPQYIYNQTAYVDGGNLDAYRRTWAGYDLGSIDSYGRRYTEFRDRRSTEMRKTLTSSTTPPIPGSGTPITITNYTLSNQYNSGNQEGRMSPNNTAGTLVPNVNSVYVFYAEIYIPTVNVGLTAAFCRIYASSNSRAEVNQNVALKAGASVRLRNQCIVAYRNGSTIPYSVQLELIYTVAPTTVEIKFGYSELIGRKNGCGAHTTL